MERWIRARFLPGLPLGRDGRRVTAGKEHIALSRRAARSPVTMVVLPAPDWVAAMTRRGICLSMGSLLQGRVSSIRYIMALMAAAAMGLPPLVPSTVI